MMEQPESLEGMIETLHSFGPSVLLVRCLVLAGRGEEAREVSKRVAVTEAARLAATPDLPPTENADLRLRVTFSELIAGRKRNARVFLNAFLREAERLNANQPGHLRDVAGSLAIAALLVGDASASAKVLGLLSRIELLPVRVLRAILDHDVGSLRACGKEVKDYIQRAGVPLWSDTWHHMLVLAIDDALCGQ